MTCWIRKVVDGESTNYHLLASESWDLREQFKILESWLIEVDGILEDADSWIADIGFTIRLDATGGGPILSSSLMRLCLQNNVEIYLSEYGAEHGNV